LTGEVITVDALSEDDFDLVSTHLNEWWGGRSMVAMLPRLWFKHFQDTCLAARNEQEQVVGFLVGYVVNSNPSQAYTHFIGVDPEYRSRGVGKLLYQRFGEIASERGCSLIEAVTSPTNTPSLAFHEALGFMAIDPDGSTCQPTKSRGFTDYDGAGEDRVILQKTLAGK
jgi:ribosomal protein S18 acetylase RimI-like enzyme